MSQPIKVCSWPRRSCNFQARKIRSSKGLEPITTNSSFSLFEYCNQAESSKNWGERSGRSDWVVCGAETSQSRHICDLFGR